MDFNTSGFFFCCLKQLKKKQVKNYRLISLKNTYYKQKIFPFSKRLQKAVGNIINEHQSAFVKIGYINESARTIKAYTLDHSKENVSDGNFYFRL